MKKILSALAGLVALTACNSSEPWTWSRLDGSLSERRASGRCQRSSEAARVYYSSLHCVIGYPAESPTPKDKWKPENVSYNEYGGKAE